MIGHDRHCVFCRIVARMEPATILYEDDDILVFRNVLRWLPLMLLVIPKQHRAQEELWRDIGAVGRVAQQMGHRFCPHGYRLVSNFGWQALQSQMHAHVHVLGGEAMDAVLELSSPTELVSEHEGFRISRRRAGWPPIVFAAEPTVATSEPDWWANIGPVGAELVRLGQRHCPQGFRLLANSGWDALQTESGPHLYLLGGADLGHYV